MSGWQGVYLHDIAEELKNIREILDRQSPRVLNVTRRGDNEPAIVNWNHVACITQDKEGATIWFDTEKNDNLQISESVFEL